MRPRNKVLSRMMPLAVLVMLFASALAIASPTPAFTQTTCASAASDPDGDGWGWENNASCRVVASTNTTTSTSSGSACVDTDGDGWGWDGSASCRVTAPARSTPAPSTPTASTPTGTAVCRSLSTVGSNGYGFENGASCRALQPVTNLSIQRSESFLGIFWTVRFSDESNTNIVGWKITRNGRDMRTIDRVPGQTEYHFSDPIALGHYFGVEPIVAGGGLDYSPTMTIVSPFDGPERVDEPSDTRVRQIFNSGSDSATSGDEDWRDNPDGSAADQAVEAFDEASENVDEARERRDEAEEAYEESWEGVGVSPSISVNGDGLSISLGMQVPAGEIYGAYQDLQDATDDVETAQVQMVNAANQVASCRGGSNSCAYSDPVVVTPPTTPGGGADDDPPGNPDDDEGDDDDVDAPGNGVCCGTIGDPNI